MILGRYHGKIALLKKHISWSQGTPFYFHSKQISRFNIRRLFFSNRIVCLWNSLPIHIILSAASVNNFNKLYDAHYNEKIMYSIVEVSTFQVYNHKCSMNCRLSCSNVAMITSFYNYFENIGWY